MSLLKLVLTSSQPTEKISKAGLVAVIRQIDDIVKPGESDPDWMADMLQKISDITAESIAIIEQSDPDLLT